MLFAWELSWVNPTAKLKPKRPGSAGEGKPSTKLTARAKARV